MTPKTTPLIERTIGKLEHAEFVDTVLESGQKRRFEIDINEKKSKEKERMFKIILYERR